MSPEETIVLKLGVELGLKVEYEQPRMKHGTQGMIGFGKEEIGTYKCMIQLMNTKDATVSLVVLDQTPVLEGKRLKMTILAQKGLKNENDTVKHGVGVDGKAASSGSRSRIGRGELVPIGGSPRDAHIHVSIFFVRPLPDVDRVNYKNL
jgi:hypothetical protein